MRTVEVDEGRDQIVCGRSRKDNHPTPKVILLIGEQFEMGDNSEIVGTSLQSLPEVGIRAIIRIQDLAIGSNHL